MSRNVLIVDDDQSVRFVLRTALRDSGWTVDEVDDGAGVEERLARAHYDLLVLDLYMPGMNGFEVLRRVRHAPPGVLPQWKTPPTVGVIVLSGEGGTDGLSFAARLGADACLRKPFDVADLLGAVRGLTR